MTLDQWLSQEQMTDDAFAELTGISRPMVNKLRRRVAKPSADSAMAIFDATHGRVPLPDLMPPCAVPDDEPSLDALSVADEATCLTTEVVT